jgi:uncharacterized protein
MGSYVSPKIEARDSSIEGKGLFAVERILRGEVVVDSTEAPGRVVSSREAEPDGRRYEEYDLQIGRDFVLVKRDKDDLETADFINHSCAPNCGVSNTFQFLAMRDIAPGEEITYDYVMTDSYEYEMECACGESFCRGVITGDDWRDKELQAKYAGFFSQYLQDEINEQQNLKKWYTIPKVVARVASLRYFL